MDFYASPVMPQGTRKGPQYQVREQEARRLGWRFSHHRGCTPRPSAPRCSPNCRACGIALHTNTDNALRALRWAGG